MNSTVHKDWSLIGKYLNNEATLAEKKEVEKKLATSEEFRKEVEKSKQMLGQVDSYYQSKKFNRHAAWIKIKPVIQKKRKINLIQKFYKYAAVLMLLLALGFVIYYSVNSFNSGYVEITTENQILKNYLLPDGSNVTLNSDTELKYSKRFNGDLREVYISGEAFFDVVPNPEKSFVIHTGDAMVTVLGTSFNVCAYPEDEKVEVLVETGTVHVTKENLESTDKNPEVLLNAGEKGTLLIAENRLEKTVNMDKNLLSWKTGILIFSETPLNQVVNYLQKIYHIKIDVKQDEVNNLVLTARFDEKPVEFILDVVRLTFDLDLTKENDRFILSQKLEPEKL